MQRKGDKAMGTTQIGAIVFFIGVVIEGLSFVLYAISRPSEHEHPTKKENVSHAIAVIGYVLIIVGGSTIYYSAQTY